MDHTPLEQGKSPQPIILDEQVGKVIFLRSDPLIMYIEGSDGHFYVTNDQEPVKRFSEFTERYKTTFIRFCGIILGNNRTACYVRMGNNDEIEMPFPGNIVQFNRSWESESEWHPKPYHLPQYQGPLPPRPATNQQPRNLVPTRPTSEYVCPVPRRTSMAPIQPPISRPKSSFFASRTHNQREPLPPAPLDFDGCITSSPSRPPIIFSAQHEQFVRQFRRIPSPVQYNENYTPGSPPPSPQHYSPVKPPPQEIWEKSDQEIESMMDELSDKELEDLMNKWYYIPEKFHREAYPYPCEGFVVTKNDNQTVLVFTRRLGCITVPDHPKRQGFPYAYFLVCGPDIYKAWDFVKIPPPSFKSTKYLNTSNVETKGYGLMAPGRRNGSESEWHVWNDQTGLMKCQSNSARNLKKKYSDWSPTCQMVMFDATSIDNGRSWIVKAISYIDYATAEKMLIFPQQVFFVKNLRVLPSKQQPNAAKEAAFYSDFLNDHVHIKLAHILDKPESITEERLYNAVVYASWGSYGQSRRFQGLVAGSESVLNELTNPSFAKLASLLELKYWDRRTDEHPQKLVTELTNPTPCSTRSDDEFW